MCTSTFLDIKGDLTEVNMHLRPRYRTRVSGLGRPKVIFSYAERGNSCWTCVCQRRCTCLSASRDADTRRTKLV